MNELKRDGEGHAPTRRADGSGSMFDRIARRYDLLNRLISLGMDQGWRRRLVATLPKEGELLDVATGTADVAIAVARARPKTQVIGLDPSAGMLEVGEEKLQRAGLKERIELILGDALELPFETNRFAGSCVSFGVRNFPDRLQGMREMTRVTAPGGIVSVLELSEPREGLLAPLTRFHVHEVVPRLGALLSGDQEYRYLQSSVEAFPPPDEFRALMEEAGLESIKIHPMPFHVAHLYVGQVPAG